MSDEHRRDGAAEAHRPVPETTVPEITVLSAPRNGTNFFCECLDAFPEIVGLYEVFGRTGVYGAGRDAVLAALGEEMGIELESEGDPRLMEVFRGPPADALALLAGATRRVGSDILAYKVFPGQVEEQEIARLIAEPHRHPLFLVRGRLDVFVSFQKAEASDTWKNTDTSGVMPEIDVDEFLAWSAANDAWFARLADGLEAIGKPYRVVSYDDDVDRPKNELVRALRATLTADGFDVTLPVDDQRERFRRQDVQADPFSKIANGDALKKELAARGKLGYALAEPLASRKARRGVQVVDVTGPPDNPLLLPERARLLHIGVPKTGTTALQKTAVRHRGQLARAGVLYPATLTKRHDHLIPAAALMERRLAETDGVPDIAHWRDLMERIDADDERRVWVSHEWISESDENQVRRFRDELGDRLHVVVSVRHYGTILTSTWQEFLKSTMLHDFEDWISYVLTGKDAPDAHTRWQVQHVGKRALQGAIVDRWARIVGPENVTVVVVDPDHRDQLTDTFEDMLGLERGMLAADESGATANRSMTVEESSLMLALNRAYADPTSPLQKERGRLPIALPGHLLKRVPGPEERKLAFPAWAAEIADRRSARQADRIEQTGARIVGSLDALRRPSRVTDDPEHNRAESVPADAAVRAATGISVEAESRTIEAVKRALAAVPVDERPRVEDTRALDLAKEAARRVAGRARGVLRRE